MTPFWVLCSHYKIFRQPFGTESLDEDIVKTVETIISKKTVFKETVMQVNIISVWLSNRSISVGLEPVLSHTDKLCIASFYIQFSTNIKMYNHYRLKPVFSACAYIIFLPALIP